MKLEYPQKIVELLKTLPKDRLSHYSSFKDVQLARFSNPQTIAEASELDLRLQYIALRDLVNDKYRNYYKLDNKLLRPKGNPEYYQRLLLSIKGEKKESFFQAMRTVIFGK